MQVDDPITLLYFPVGHASHGPPSAPVYPLLHLQSVIMSLPESEFENTGHCAQSSLVDDAEKFRYVSAGQKLQFCGPSSSLYFPGMHEVHG
eukprot:765933-Hanusia_phi.AAC.2